MSYLPVLSSHAVRVAESRFPQLLGDGTLMLRAATAVAAECFAVLRNGGGIVGRHALLLVGSGDNGGDALFAGAALVRRGVAVAAWASAGAMHDAGAAAFRAAGGRVVDTVGALALFDRLDLVIDGIVGLGSTRPLAGDAALLAKAVADAQLFTLAIDIPSGVHADTGATPGVAIHADITMTFGSLRRAHVIAPAALHCGEVLVADIDVPMDSQDIALLDTGTWFQPPSPDSDKYSRGVVGLVTGSQRYPGAALLSSGAALRSGCGMVRYFGDARDHVLAVHPEVVAGTVSEISETRCQAWLIGSGAGTDDDAAMALAEVLLRPEPVVIDADAITLVARDRHLKAMVVDRRARHAITIFTPHAGELERLANGLGLVISIANDRLAAAESIARALQAVVLLKGPSTLVTDGERFVATPMLGSRLATAGSGDVLAGLLGGALARWSTRDALSAAEVLRLAAACALRHAAAAARDDLVASDLIVGLDAASSATMRP